MFVLMSIVKLVYDMTNDSTYDMMCMNCGFKWLMYVMILQFIYFMGLHCIELVTYGMQVH